MRSNRLHELNTSKTEVLWCATSRRQDQIPTDPIRVGGDLNELQSLFRNCEKELRWLDMRINAKKLCCLRIGPRFNATCTCVITSDGHSLPWVSEMRYLGIYFCTGRNMRCSVSYAKRSFYRWVFMHLKK